MKSDMKNYHNYKISCWKNFTFFLLFVSGITFSQTISATNGTENPCGDCTPSGWFDGGGTPDISNNTVAASSTTSGGGARWSENPDGGGAIITLPTPPNTHSTWLSLRDIGSAGAEESVYTTLGGLTIGREYEVVLYALKATTKTGNSSQYYAPRYIDKFSFEVVGATPIVEVDMSAEPPKVWIVKQLRFTATATSHVLYIRPGRDTVNINNHTRFETIQLSATLNALNTIPVAEDDTASTTPGQPVTVNVLENDSEYDNGQIVVPNSVDLDPSTPGIQDTFTNSQGSWTVDASGIVTFIPAPDFVGTATISYTVQDNYTIPGSNPLTYAPATSLPAFISVTVVADCTDSGVTSVNLNSLFDSGEIPHDDVEIEWWTSPTRDLDPLNSGTRVPDPTDVTESGTYYAFFYDTVNDCYNTDNSTANVTVIILPPCDTSCTQPPADGIPDGYTKVGITVQEKQSAWPENIPNGFITLESKEKGFVITRVSHVGGTDGTPSTTDAIADPKEGMLLYDIADECVKLFNGVIWNCINRGCNDAFSINTTDLNYSGGDFCHIPDVGYAHLTYIGGYGMTYGQIVSTSTGGVTGLTATLSPGTMAIGNGELVFEITGTPSGYGNAIFTFTFDGQYYTFTYPVIGCL